MLIRDLVISGTLFSILPEDIINKINKILAIDFIINYYYLSNKRVNYACELIYNHLHQDVHFTDFHIELIFKIRELFRSKIIHKLDISFWKKKLNIISHILFNSYVYVINNVKFYRYDIFTQMAQSFYSKIIYKIMISK